MFTWIENTEKPTRLTVKPKENILTPSHKTSSFSKTASTSVKTSISSTEQKNVNNKTSKSLLSKGPPQGHGKLIKDPVWVHNRYQRAVGGKDPNGRKAFPRSDPQNEQYYPMELSRSQDNFIEITLLVQDFLPVAFCLQETHLKKNDNINLKNYSVYSTYVDENERAAGGSTILVRDNILHSYVNLNTDLQAVAVRITLDKTVTLCSVYIPLLWT
jgi:hypothetical protein